MTRSARSGLTRPQGPPCPAGRSLRGAALLVPLPALVFALITGQAWEDFFISLRHSVNLVEHGELTYQLGERIQGFSSPFATVLGALAWAATGASLAATLWVLRAAALAAVFATALLLARLFTRSGASSLVSIGCVLFLLAFESKQVAFAANGMETPFFVLFVTLSLGLLAREGGARPPAVGLAWAGVLFCRPDGIVFVGLLALGHLLFGAATIRARLTHLVRAGFVGALAYAPWLVFSWSYFGSPVPQTVRAKEHLAGGFGLAALGEKLASLPLVASLTFQPPYAQFDAWPALQWTALGLGVFVLVLWAGPRMPGYARTASFAALGATVYLTLIGAWFPWYFPPVLVLALVGLHPVVEGLWSLGARGGVSGRVLALAPPVLLAGLFVHAYVGYTALARRTYRINEEEGRIPLGRWLGEHAEAGDTVFLECPGFIGFHSGLEMLDYPGLVSPRASAVTAEVGPRMHRVGWRLRPDWLVLRPSERARFERIDGFAETYELVMTFDQRREMRAAAPGRQGPLYDSAFFVLRRR